MTKQMWTSEEVALLTERATSSSASELARLLDRPIKMVRWKAGKLGLTLKDGRLDNPGRAQYVWNDESLTYLRANAALLPAADIGAHLGLTEKQIRQALFHYGIAARGVSRPHTPEETEKRIAALRGVEKVDRAVDRPCTSCGEVKPVHLFASEKVLQSTLCYECRLLRSLSVRYSTPIHVLRQMIAAQNHACLLCSVEFTPSNARSGMVVDHDHACCPGIKSCGKCVRGLLCVACNILVGHYEGYMLRVGSFDRVTAYLAGPIVESDRSSGVSV